jgi:type IV secretion system protein VirB7
MLRIVSLFLIAGALCGCGSMLHRLPKCDGYARRPLNRSMWQWEDTSKLKRLPAQAVPAGTADPVASYAADTVKVTPAAFTLVDIEGSYRPCEGK